MGGPPTTEKWHISLRQSAFCKCGKPATHEIRNQQNYIIDWCCETDAKARVKAFNEKQAAQEKP